MGSPQVVQWDVDGVLADFRGAWRDLVKERYGYEITLNETSWDELYAPTGGPHGKETNATWAFIRQSSTFWYDVNSLATMDDWQRIRNPEYEQYFVTSRPGQWAKWLTQTWLEDHGVVRPTVIISGRKADSANALGASYVIDDKPGNVLAVYYQSPPERKVYIRDHTFNRFDPDMVGRRIRRVATVAEFLDDVEAGR